LQGVILKLNSKNEIISTSSIEIEVLKKTKRLHGFSKMKSICKYENYDTTI
jgi:hypothetical protein